MREKIKFIVLFVYFLYFILIFFKIDRIIIDVYSVILLIVLMLYIYFEFRTSLREDRKKAIKKIKTNIIFSIIAATILIVFYFMMRN
jgi:hypothetical protein